MTCKCNSSRIAKISGKCDDRFTIEIDEFFVEGDYVPDDIGIGGGDYIKMSYCLDCGQIQGNFPLEYSKIESESDLFPEDDNEEFVEDEDGDHDENY